MAMGIDVVPIWNLDMNAVIAGMNLPDNTPIAIAVNIQSVKCLSKKESLLFILFQGFRAAQQLALICHSSTARANIFRIIYKQLYFLNVEFHGRLR